MKSKLFSLVIRLNLLLQSEEGQDLIEYALLVALVAFGATASMKTLATKVGAAFGDLGTSLSSTIT